MMKFSFTIAWLVSWIAFSLYADYGSRSVDTVDVVRCLITCFAGLVSHSFCHAIVQAFATAYAFEH